MQAVAVRDEDELNRMREDAVRNALAELGGGVTWTVADDVSVQYRCVEEIRKLCASQGFPVAVTIAAILFMRRFYLRFSPLVRDPQTTICACIFLAGKTEENRVPLTDLVRICGGGLSASAVAAREREVLDALQFRVTVNSPHRILRGMLQHLGLAPDNPVSVDAYRAAHLIVDTDAPLLFPAVVLAATALRAAAPARWAEFSSQLVPDETERGDLTEAVGRTATRVAAAARIDGRSWDSLLRVQRSTGRGPQRDD